MCRPCPLILLFWSIYLIAVDSRLTRHLADEGDERATNNRRKLIHRKLIQTDHEDGVTGSYIVHFKDDISNEEVEEKAKELVTQIGGKILCLYKEIFKGFAITKLDSIDHLEDILNRDDIEIMDQDIKVHIDDSEFFPYSTEVDFVQIGDEVPNGLDRIDQVGLPLDDLYMYREFGKNVTVFVLDTGIKLDHVDFQGRATCGLDPFRTYIKNEFFEPFDNDFFDNMLPKPFCNDSYNHGTPVAAIIGGLLSGVAKQTNIVSVKVISENGGTASSVLAGLEYVRLQKMAFPSKPMIINMSLGSIYSKSVNQAVDRVVEAGVVVVAAAGNRGISACWVSPASATSAITVGAATTSYPIFRNRDRRTIYSNWGRCVDIFAPGNRIRSASTRNRTRYGLITGTSIAAPHVTGVIARYLERDPTMTPDQIREKLMSDASHGRLIHIFQLFSPNRLLHIEPDTKT